MKSRMNTLRQFPRKPFGLCVSQQSSLQSYYWDKTGEHVCDLQATDKSRINLPFDTHVEN